MKTPQLLLGLAIGAAVAIPAHAQLFIPDQLIALPKLNFGDIPSHINISIGQQVPLDGTPFVIDETNMQAASPPVTEEGGAFERNEHLIRFRDAAAGDPITGHAFQREEAWDFAFDVTIDAKVGSPRKEAGIYFESSLGNSIFTAYTNPNFYEYGDGTVASVFTDILPNAGFNGGGGGPLGDYNLDGVVNAADYTIWRDTEGSTEDFRANGDNEGPSENLIDRADYDVWAAAYGDGELNPPPLVYQNGDTVSMRLVYTPPELDENIPFDSGDPSANVLTPGTMEYIVALNDGPEQSTGPLDITNSWMGIPDGTLISLRAQNLSTASAAPDFAITTFANFDFDGPDASLAVPEPTAAAIAAVLVGAVAPRRRRRS